MKILITGSTGLVGTALTQDLQRAGHTVCRLIRPNTSTQSIGTSQGFDVNWNPATGELGGAAVGADAVVNLAGASIAQGRWTAQRKQLLRFSRVDTTRALVQALAKMSARPRPRLRLRNRHLRQSRGRNPYRSQPNRNRFSE